MVDQSDNAYQVNCQVLTALGWKLGFDAAALEFLLSHHVHRHQEEPHPAVEQRRSRCSKSERLPGWQTAAAKLAKLASANSTSCVNTAETADQPRQSVQLLRHLGSFSVTDGLVESCFHMDMSLCASMGRSGKLAPAQGLLWISAFAGEKGMITRNKGAVCEVVDLRDPQQC